MSVVFWLIILAATFGAMFLLVPMNKIRDYFSFGIYFGVLFAFLILFVSVTLFKLWRIENQIIRILDFDLTLVLVWFPLAVIFCHYINRFSHNWYSLLTYIAFFAGIVTIGKYFMGLLGFWIDIRGNSLTFFLIAIAAHMIMSAYLILRGYIPRPGKII